MSDEIKLCACSSGCCPAVTFGDDSVSIKDDYDGVVTLTYTELDLLFNEYKKKNALLTTSCCGGSNCKCGQ